MVSRNSGLHIRGRAGPAPRTPTSPLKVEVKPATGVTPQLLRSPPPPEGRIGTQAPAQALRCSPNCSHLLSGTRALVVSLTLDPTPAQG